MLVKDKKRHRPRRERQPHNSKRQAGRRGDTRADQRSHLRVWYFHRKYAESDGRFGIVMQKAISDRFGLILPFIFSDYYVRMMDCNRMFFENGGKRIFVQKSASYLHAFVPL